MGENEAQAAAAAAEAEKDSHAKNEEWVKQNWGPEWMDKPPADQAEKSDQEQAAK